MVTGTYKKNVIIGGSTKCGTTSLFQYLSVHPQVCSSIIKETRFFWQNEYELPKHQLNKKEVRNYDDFFFNCSDHQWRLEATPDYLYSSSVAEKIKSTLPDCRFIFIFRDPLERIISWFKFSKQLGYLPTHYQLDDYISLLLKSENSASPQYLRALEQGKYGSYLQHYLNLFRQEHILVAFYSDLRNDTRNFMFSICDFLKIDSFFYQKFYFRIYNPSLNVKSSEHYIRYEGLKKIIRKYNNKLSRVYRDFFKKLLKPLDVFYLKSKSTKWEKVELSLRHKKVLAEYYHEDSCLLEKILNKKIKW